MVNKVILIGRLGRDPELRRTASGTAVANFTLATNESWTNRSGERETQTEWHRIVCWAKLAEFAAEYLQKGRQVYVEGRLQTREWEDREGTKRRTTEINARTIQFVGSRSDSDASRSTGTEYGGDSPASEAPASEGAESSAESAPLPNQEEDIPF